MARYTFFLLEQPKAGAPGFHNPSGKFVYGQAYTDVPGFTGTFYFGLDANKSSVGMVYKHVTS
jgi:hypothetical protein